MVGSLARGLGASSRIAFRGGLPLRVHVSLCGDGYSLIARWACEMAARSEG
jgi:hypothetical protein